MGTIWHFEVLLGTIFYYWVLLSTIVYYLGTIGYCQAQFSLDSGYYDPTPPGKVVIMLEMNLFMVWYGLLWFGMVWYGLVWNGINDIRKCE